MCADIVALDQTLVYNRFGSFNPYGMIFALARDVDPLGGAQAGAPACETDTATRKPGALPGAGAARLRDCKRPRPLVLRANVGDVLVVRVTNLLAPAPGPDFSEGLCGGARTADHGREAVRSALSSGTRLRAGHGEVTCSDGSGSSPAEAAEPAGADANWPRTRNLNFVAQGLLPLPVDGEVPKFCLGTDTIPPGESFTCRFRVGQEGTHFFASHAAPAGGNGDGGSITHGLFGAVLAERPGTRWYRSQVSAAALDAAWPGRSDQPRHARSGMLDYEAADPVTGVPYLNLAQAVDRPQVDFGAARAVEIVHSDLNAIIFCDDSQVAANARPPADPLGCAIPTATALGDAAPPRTKTTSTVEPDVRAFREFTVFFHDELKTFYTRNFEELASFGQLAGVRDGFAINYGASGMGTLLLANRKGIGPAATCAECLYEEFFLTSWANGDPALLEWFDDDPSNVHHSYLNDPVVFRNFHAGPKETHVFHLHAHQWFAGNDPGRGSYLDSQTVAPAQGFTYNIYHGGRNGQPGKWATGGSGNRNRTVGDSIFHCHLYPHFAQGMWALWRVHDVLEDGTRQLPDGQAQAGLSTYIRNPDEATMTRPGSVDPVTGAWTGAEGTPIPALVPLPGEPLPPLPTYTPAASAPSDSAALNPPMLRRFARDLPARFGPRRPAPEAGLMIAGPERLLRTQTAAPAAAPVQAVPAETPAAEATPAGAAPIGMPGYPFYIAGQSGRRPPQAPLDIARDSSGKLLSGGLGRHVVRSSDRAMGISLPQKAAQQDAAMAATLNPDPANRDRATERRLERLRAQIVAKAVAMGDMTAHLERAHIETLPPDGTPLEQAAMRFHNDGAALQILNPSGIGISPAIGGYVMPRAPVPAGTPPAAYGLYEVNGSPPKPGAPFADPCGVAARDGRAPGIDPLTGQGGFLADRKMIGFRRYEASAVQLDLVVNKAGWHDPQARINVLTAKSDDYKKGEGIISPRISDQDEPFFFRALSGECLEFRHTNELPKELALDDFQVRTPTDTIGQHIHLVKFDVTSSDGSGNGWNYEDGTFAADELMSRRCAAVRLTGFGGGDPAPWGTRVPEPAECAALNTGQIWRRPLGAVGPAFAGSTVTNRDLFQTTAQRWFADPILTRDGAGRDVDRTMRTVFSHDHFGPSSIQQHGFYTALLIEPSGGDGITQKVCSMLPEPKGTCADLTPDIAGVASSPEGLVGASKLIDMGKHDPLHPNYREFALAIADFALLYDPRDRSAAPPVVGGTWAAADAGLKGLGQIYCEADFGTRGNAAGMERACASGLMRDGSRFSAAGEGVPPAWVAAGRPGDYAAHRGDLWGNLFLRKGELGADGLPVEHADAQILRDRLYDHRFAAAFPTAAARLVGATQADRLAQPVAGPQRPEAISVDHHDPYLVNYRMAAVPLRLGTKNRDGSPDQDCAMFPMSPPGLAAADSPVVAKLAAGGLRPCSFRYQLAGAAGDAAFAFSSRNPVADQTQAHAFDPARDPETPILEAYQNDRLVFRLVQGAQEVQHVFGVAGLPFRRNIDQIYPQAMRPLATIAAPARAACFAALRRTHPEEYDAWLAGEIADLSDLTPVEAAAYLAGAPAADRARLERWRAIAQALARCDNLEGMVYAQEVGISEHFEMRGRLRQDVAISPERLIPSRPAGGRTDRRYLGRSDISDYLYSFGTLDSLWNGDWGLVRIYRDGKVSDPRLPASDSPVPISNRLRPLRQYDGELAVVPAIEDAEAAMAHIMPGEGTGMSSTGLPTCPMALPGRQLRFSTGFVVALRTGDLAETPQAANRGTDYGMGQYDRDGLMLALMPALPGVTAAADRWGQIDRNAVLAAVRAQYARPEPFVMRVNAGDCVLLRIVNTLSEPAPGAGIRDVLGDALMPPITPLNTDPVLAAKHGTREGRLSPVTVPETGLRPSARLGLTFGLPGGAAVEELPSGFGLNAPPIAAATATMAPISPEFGFYAGRVAYRGWKEPVLDCVDLEAALPEQIDACVLQAESARLADLRTALGLNATPALQLLMENANAPDAMGFTYRAGPKAKLLALTDMSATPPAQWLVRNDLDEPFQPKGAAADLAGLLCPAAMAAGDCTTALRRLATSIGTESVQAHRVLSDSLLHWIPYAYGPVPIKVTGDMISQPAHGMFGVIDVLPQHWPLPDAQNPLTGAADDAATRAIMAQLHLPVSAAQAASSTRAIAPVPGFGQGQAYQVSTSAVEEGGGAALPIREFVLFYQDGLNLRDSQSRMRWWRDGAGAPPMRFQVGPPVPACAVCDDSYDLGAAGVSYRSAGYVPRLREMGAAGLERHHDLNAQVFPPDFFRLSGDGGRMPLTLQACQGEQVVIRVVHPGGRARQRAFVMNGLGYDDLFPGFGFPNAALLAPGKSVSAWLTPLETPVSDQPVSYLWGDGPGTLMGGGTWGLLEMLPAGSTIGTGAEARTCGG
ncbi:hypothetical protein [Paracoccus sp. S1E-3]|uniref:hypothetical protein n=1 Tax=Paracoccus sp. S1E-3 TaxID=2756130 RepID=UPI0015EEB48F|nr:hypothetical protein [Paracoccus sp. S1E-3]MBA4490501.1 hypothetical protein [Paracoccus sp. S1E-3]